MSDDREPAVRKLTLEIRADADPIRGRVSDGRERGEAFVGWLGLARALERVLEGDATRGRT